MTVESWFCQLVAPGMIAWLSGCGRLGFDELGSISDAAQDAAPADACTFGAWTVVTPQPFDKVNTSDTEWGSQISADGLIVVFSSNRPNPTNPTTPPEETLYLAQRATPSDPFGDPIYLSNLNDDPSANPRDPTISADEREIYFVADDTNEQCIYTSRSTGTISAWGNPRKLPELCWSDGTTLGGPYLSNDGLRLYYDTTISDDQRTVWMASRTSRNTDFGQGTRVNGLPLGLGYCSLTADERTIFCEVGPPDRKPQVWQATRPSFNVAFGSPSPVLELMSGDEDGDPSITADGTQLVYATTRNGSSDLRVFRRACQ